MSRLYIRALTALLALAIAACNSESASHADDPALVQSRLVVPELLPVPVDSILPTDSLDGVTAGQLPGSFEVTHDGAASYTIPLWVPEGRAGMQPHLSLHYDSRGGNGPLGVGWSLTGFSQITRCGKTLAQDGKVGGILFDTSDVFCLDGQRLVMVKGEVYGGHGTEYRTEIDGFTKIISWHADPQSQDPLGPTWFQVFQKDGRILSYGTTPGSLFQGQRVRVAPSGDEKDWDVSYQVVRYAWSLSEERDRSDNCVLYHYELTEDATDGSSLEQLPVRIDYTATCGLANSSLRSVRFFYDVRPDGSPSPRTDQDSYFVSGLKLRSSKRLARLEMWGPHPTVPALLREYRLDYSNDSLTERSLLKFVTECDGLSVCHAPRRFDWELGDPGFEEFVTDVNDAALNGDVFQSDPEPNGEDLWLLQAGDINADGRDDIFYRRTTLEDGKLSPGMWYFRLSTGANFLLPLAANFPGSRSGGTHEDLRLVDLNLDGRVDVVSAFPPRTSTELPYHFESNAGYQVFENVSHGDFPMPGSSLGFRPGLEVFSPMTWICPPGFPCLSRYPKDFSSLYVADLNGDARPDLVTSGLAQSVSIYEDKVTAWSYHLNQTPGTGQPFSFDQPRFMSMGSLSGLNAVDVDGDRRTELVMSVPDGNLSYLSVWKAAFSHNAAGGSSERRETALVTGHFTLERDWLVDVNGDGLADSVKLCQDKRCQTIDYTLDVALNTGNGFLRPFRQQLSAPYGIVMPDKGKDPGIRVMDYDGDGKNDLLLVRNSRFYVLLARGNHLVPRELPLPDALMGNNGAVRLTQVLDANGDGLSDIVRLGEDMRLHLFLRKGQKADVLVAVHDGFGEELRISYASIGKGAKGSTGAVYPKETDCPVSYPLTCVQRGVWVVFQYFVRNGNGSTNRFECSYQSGRADLAGRGWLGFARRTLLDFRRSVLTTYIYGNEQLYGTNYPLAGRVLEMQSVERLTIGASVNEKRANIQKTVYETTSRAGLGGPAILTVLPKEETEIEEGYVAAAGSRVPVRQVQTFFDEYDAYGNLRYGRQVHKGGYTLSWNEEYENREGDWLLGLSTLQRATSTVPSGRSQTRTLRKTYDTRGLLETVTVEPDDPELYLHTTLMRSARGLVEHTIQRDFEGRVRESHVYHDPLEGMFPAAITNALGHTERVAFHPGLGVQVAREDANGIGSRWAYDGFGRIRLIDVPGDADTTYKYYSLGSDIAAPEKVEIETAGGKKRTVFLDTLGRTFQWRWQGFDGYWVYINTGYDDLGRLLRKSRPYFPSTHPAAEGPYYSTLEYDTLDRVRFKSEPDDTTRTEYVYDYLADGFKVRTIGPGGRENILYEDAAGNITSSVDLDDASREIPTHYALAPFGLAATVTDAKGNVLNVIHDRLGRRVRVEDPDSGVHIFKYNAFGEVIEERDGNGDVTTYIRDALGRETSVITREGTTTFEWDTAPMDHPPMGSTRVALGMLSKARSPDGILTVYTYDEFGRVKEEGQDVGGVIFLVNHTYDAYGRPLTLQYPGAPGLASFKLWYGYSLGGELQEVRQNDSSGRLFWRAESRTAEGQLKSETFGNGVTSTRTYNGKLGLLKSITTSSGAELLQQYQYGHDVRGNLRWRTDSVTATGETFEYDRLDRLKTWSTGTLDASSCQFTPPGPFSRPECPLPADTSLAEHYVYDDLGNLMGRQGAIDASYGENGAGPHAMTALSSSGFRETFTYDRSGNQTAVDSPLVEMRRRVEYTPFNLPRVVHQPYQDTSFQYDAFHQRTVKQSQPGEKTVYMGGLYERREKDGKVVHVFYVQGTDGPVAEVLWAEQGGVVTSEAVLYLHGDHLGSVAVVTDAEGRKLETRAFDPFGTAWSFDVWPNLSASNARLGFTSHEHDDELGLINMKGRMYDPRLGRFLSPDPIIQFPFSSQSYNSYSYALNNPLKWTDPTGFTVAGGGPEGMVCVYGCNTNISVWWPAEEVGTKGAGGVGMRSGSADDQGSLTAETAEAMVAPSSLEPSGAQIASQMLSGVGNAVGDMVGGTLNMLLSPSHVVYEQVSASVHEAYRQDGVSGVINNFNPVYQVLTSGYAARESWARGDYEGAAYNGFNSTFTAVSTAVSVVGIARSAASIVPKGVSPYQVGRFNKLKALSEAGDGLDIHHAGQKHPMSQLVPGYDPETAPSIAIPHREHLQIPTAKGPVPPRGLPGGTARSQLAKDIWDLRRYTNAPNSALQELIRLNKELYKEAFLKWL